MRSNVNGDAPQVTGLAIVPDGVHPGIQEVKSLVGVIFWGIISYWGCQIIAESCLGVETTQAGGVLGSE